MSIIPQQSLFSWQQVDRLDDLQRLNLVLQGLCDEELMLHLEQQRGKGRNDYPVRAMWNSIIAGIVFGHESIESLRRELARNAPLRQLCGFDLFFMGPWAPPSSSYTRFLKSLFDCQKLIDDMFNKQVKALQELLPDLGNHLAGDSKAIESHANKPRKSKDGETVSREPDGRRDLDADVGVKKYPVKQVDGTTWIKVKHWFGYKMHLVVDSKYELPVARTLTKASRSDVAEMKQNLLPQMEQDQPEILNNCEAMMLDKAYDDTHLITTLHNRHDIAPIIDIRHFTKDGKEQRALEDGPKTSLGRNKSVSLPVVYYDHKGDVSCWSSKDSKHFNMAYGGYEKDRNTLKYRCPHRHHGISCASKDTCPIGSGSGQVRIPLKTDERIFTKVARSSYKWKDLYNERSAVERVNSRVDQNFGFHRHFIRGIKKMALSVDISLITMLAMACGRILNNQAEHVRSLVRLAA